MAKRPSNPINPLQVQQQVLSNQAVQLMLRSGAIQAKLTVNPPNDKYELEADRVAEQVMRMSNPLRVGSPFSKLSHGISINRACPLSDEEEIRRQSEEEEEEEILQTKPAPGQTPKVTPELEGQIGGLRGRGQPLPKSVRDIFEPRFGHDFSRVRVHARSDAAAINRRLNSHAFTKGWDIFFHQNAYNPATSGGLELLAHELAHVLQQQCESGFESHNTRSHLRASPDYLMLDASPDEDSSLEARRQSAIELIPRIALWIENILMRGTGGLIIGYERLVPATGEIIVGGGSDWPPETLFQRRERLLNFKRDLEDILDQLRRGPIPPGWVSRLRREETREEEERSAGASPNGEVSGFGGVVEDVIHFYTQFLEDAGRNIDLASINIFYIESFTSARPRSPTAQETGINIVVPDPSRPRRVIRVTGTTGLDVDPVSGRRIPPEGRIIRQVFRDSRGLFYRWITGRIDLERMP